MKTKPCLRCGLPVRINFEFGCEYAECLSCGFEWECERKYIRAWLRDEAGNEVLSEAPVGCLLVVEK